MPWGAVYCGLLVLFEGRAWTCLLRAAWVSSCACLCAHASLLPLGCLLRCALTWRFPAAG